MKNKLFSIFTALAMVLGILVAPFTSARAADDANTNISKDPKAVTKTVTLHKLMMTKAELKAWDSKAIEEKGYDGSQNLEALKKFLTDGHTAHEADNVFFAWKVKGKETTNEGGKTVAQYIKGKEVDGVMTPEFNGEDLVLTTKIDEAFGGLTKNSAGIKFDTSKLKGAFIIDEVKEKSTYKNDGNTIVDQKAVPVEITLPLANKLGTVIDAHVYPKNTESKPKIDKNFKKADTTKNEKELEKATGFEEAEENAGIGVGANVENYKKKKATAKAEIGKKIPYEVKTKIEAGTSYENLTWNDIMTNGLTFNKDLTITADNGVTFAKPDPNTHKSADYELVQDDNGFRLQLTPTGLKKINDVTLVTETEQVKRKDVTITIQYSATVNGTAVVDHPEKNNVTLEYGHKPGNKHTPKDVTPKDGKLKVTKKIKNAENAEDPSETNAKDLKLVYTLRKGDKAYSVALTVDNKASTDPIDLGDGIKFTVTGLFAGEFSGLGEDATGWTIEERVAGYNPEYATTDEAGQVTITNKKDNDNPPPLTPTVPQVVVGGKKFVKTTEKKPDQVQDADRLAGAKFVVKNEAGKYLAAKSVDTVKAEQEKLAKAKTALDEAVKKYNERKDDTNKAGLVKAVNEAQDTYNKAFKTAGIRYEWKDKSSDDGVVFLVSNEKGQFEINGLEYGKYKLEEIDAPKGYAKRNDQDFTVAKGTDTDTDIKYDKNDGANNAKQVVNRTVTIPQTGGIGSLIFVVAGVAIMAFAYSAYRKSQYQEA